MKFQHYYAHITRKQRLLLKEVERAKIGCAEKLFNNLSTSNVRYHKVDNYQTLLDIMKSMD